MVFVDVRVQTEMGTLHPGIQFERNADCYHKAHKFDAQQSLDRQMTATDTQACYHTRHNAPVASGDTVEQVAYRLTSELNEKIKFMYENKMREFKFQSIHGFTFTL